MEELDLLELFKTLAKSWKTIILTSVLGGVIGILCSMFIITPMYCSTAKIYIRGTSAVSSTLADLQLGSYLSSDYEVIFKARPILEKTISDLKMDITYKELEEMIKVSTITNTRILKISCTSESPELSKDITNSIVKNGVETVNEIDAKQPYILEKAVIETKPVSLSLPKTTIIGTFIGMVLGSLYVFIQKVFNNKIDTVEDIETILKLPVLGSIPKSDKVDFLYKKEKINERSIKN